MTTHLRARWAQAGALLAVVVGGLAVAPAVALADPPDVQITSLSTDVLSGSSVNMIFHVSPAGGGNGGGPATADIRVSGMDCQGTCSQLAQVDQGGKDFTVTLRAPTVNAGATKTVTVTVTATINAQSKSANQPVNVKGPDKPQTVTSVSGKVRDQNNKSISGANVAMKDSNGHSYSATTNGSGAYSFVSSDSQPISPGTISVGALKDGYDAATVSVQASAGKAFTVPLTLKTVAATASASPSVTASAPASAAATDPATGDPTTDDTAPANTDTTSASADQGGSFGSTLFLVLGGLLVAGGVGAIVLVLMRRKNNDSNGPDDDPTAMGGGGGVVPPSQGRFNDATRVASPMGAGPAQTMMAPRAASSPMADAPTMLHRPVEDEFPDPYGAPVPRQGGNQYGGGGWDDQQQPAYGAGVPGGTQQYGGGAQYGEPTQYGQAQDDGYGGGTYGAAAAPAGGGQYGAAAAPADGGTYGAAAAPAGGGQYGGGAQRYDEPTGMYRPEADQGGYEDYGQYGGGQQQYSGGQYGGSGYDQAGYADQGGYGAQSGSGGQYGGGQYDQGGYDQGGYVDQGGQRGTYGGGQYGGGSYDQGGYDQGGYDEQRGGYNEPPSRRGQVQPTHPGQRRSSDWEG